MAIKQSNIERGRWRDKCRAALAAHIEQKTGIPVSEADVRLIASPRDPYTWKWLPEAQEIFTKQLSEHSVGIYRKIFEGIGQIFEAIPKDAESEKLLSNEPNKTSVIAQIEVLEQKISSLERTTQDQEAGITAEEERNHALASELMAMKDRYRASQQETQSWKQKAQDAEQALSTYSDRIKKMLGILQSFQISDGISRHDKMST